MIQIGQAITSYKTREVAEKVAAANQDDDAAAEYRVVEQIKGRFVVAVYDNGEFVACL